MDNSSWKYVIKDMKNRNKFGLRKYGRVLNTTTNKDFLQELYEELLDAIVYLKTELLKRDENKTQVSIEQLRFDFNKSIKDTENSIFHPYPFSEK